MSIIGIDKFETGYNAAKVAHEKAMRAGPVPVRIVRSAQFHDSALYASGAALPGPNAILGGPTFDAWLDATH